MNVLKDKQLTRDFREGETKCRCRRKECDAKPMTAEVMSKAQLLRDLFGKPLRVNSAARCAYWNTMVGGAPSSEHLNSNALDLAPYNCDDIPLLAQLAEKAGFSGVGVGQIFIHVDCGAPGRRWTY